MLVWMMNDAPLQPKHGAPLRLVVPFRYGNRSIKAITEMMFATPACPRPRPRLKPNCEPGGQLACSPGRGGYLSRSLSVIRVCHSSDAELDHVWGR